MFKIVSRWRIRTRILFSSMVTLLLMSAFILAYYPAREKKELYAAMKQKDHSVAEMIALGLGVGLGTGSFEAVTEALEWAKADSSLAYALVYDIDRDKIAAYNPDNLKIRETTLFERDGLIEVDGITVHAVSIAINYRGVFYGTLLFGTTLEDVKASITQSILTSLQVCLTILILGLMLSLYFSRLITRPLSDLQLAVERFAHGDSYVTAPSESPDEVGSLGRAFNRMVESIRQTVKKLRESEEKYRSIFETAASLIVVIDHEGKIVDCNDSMLPVLGYKRTEIIGQPFRMLLTSYKDSLDEASILSDGRVATTVETKLLMTRKDLSTISVSTKVTRFALSASEEIGRLCIIEDISEQELSKQVLQQSERRFKQLTEYMPFPVVVVSHDSLEYANQNFRELFHYENSLSVDQWLEKSIPDHDLCQKTVVVWHADQSKVSDLGTLSRTIDLTCRDSIERKFDLKFVSLSEKRTLVICEDISERDRKVQERLNSQKLESIGLLAGGIAHDFNNLLTVIVGQLSSMMSDNRFEQEDALRLHEVQEAADEAAKLTQQLLTFATGGRPVQRMTAISDFLEEAVRLGCRGTNVRLKYSCEELLPPVQLDVEQVSQAIRNVVVNAVQAMPDGGELLVSVAVRSITCNDNVPLEEGRFICIRIEDEGCGIPEGNLPRVFDPYFSTPENAGGLGLATAYSIVIKHGGHIAVSSEEGVGTAFDLYFPAPEMLSIDEPSKPEVVVRSEGCESNRQAKRILVMDDEEMIQKLTRRILEKAGYQVTVAADGETAAELCRQAQAKGHSFELAILDLTVPGGMGGKDAIKQLRLIDDKIKAIVCSGYSNDEVLSEFSHYGFDGVLQKPFRANQLLDAVNSVLHSERQSVGGKLTSRN